MTVKHCLLKERWISDEGVPSTGMVTSAIRRNSDLQSLGLDIVDGRYDLRGIRLDKPKKVEEIRSHSRVTGAQTFKGSEFKKIDFSHATLDFGVFVNCSFVDCVFFKTRMKNIRITACDLRDCSFLKSDLSNSFLNLNVGKDSGSFINCEFIETNISKTEFGFPKIHNCSFVDCKLKEVNFDGSRFERCVFKGQFESGWFNGYSIYASKSTFGLFNRVNPKAYPNEMIEVDFGEAMLEDVQFQNGINISNCILPRAGNYFVVKNLDKVYPEVISVINETWKQEDKVILIVIENLYYKKKDGMPMDLINMDIPEETYRIEVYPKLFDLIQFANSKYLNDVST